ncbi:MAG: hypothetical protein WCO92_03705 [Verrucomicrobiota bacterium]
MIILFKSNFYLENQKQPKHRGVVAFMGGHRALRSSPLYFEVATLCRQLTRDGFLIATGGGNGLMEAANLGAWLAPLPDEELKKAVDMLCVDGANASNDPLWLSAAWNVRNQTLQADINLRRSLSISTWQFEQQNIFSTDIASFFNYELREKTLIAIAKQGLIYGPGSTGTFEEIFRAAYQNHYTKSKYGYYSPMIFFKKDYWDPALDQGANYPKHTVPVWPLISKIAQESNFKHTPLKRDSVEEIEAFIKGFSFVATIL